MNCFICGVYEQGCFTVSVPEKYRSWDFCSVGCLERLKKAIDEVLPEAQRKEKQRKPRKRVQK